MKKLPVGFRERDGKLQYRFSYNGERCSVSGKTIKECRQKEREIRDQIDLKLNRVESKTTFAEYFEEYLNRGSRRQSSTDAMRSKFQKVVKEIGTMRMCDIDRPVCLKLQSKLKESVHPNTVNWLISNLRSVFREAMNDRIMSYNPADNIKALKSTEQRARETIHRALSDKEYTDFFKYAQGSYYENLFKFMVSTGVRAGEASALTWENISDKDITITSTTARTKDGIVINPAKTSAGCRKIPLTDSVREILDAQKKLSADLFGIRYLHKESRVFIQQLNPDIPLVSSAITHGIDAVILQAEKDGCHIEHFSSHAFRDTFATFAIEQGMDMNTLKEILGHTKISVTMDLYAHVRDTTKKEAMERLSIRF